MSSAILNFTLVQSSTKVNISGIELLQLHYQHVYQRVVTIQEISALEQLSTQSDMYVYSLTNTLSSIQTKLSDVCHLHVQATYLLGMHS